MPSGILVVVSVAEAKAAKAARNLAGVDVCTPKSLSVSLLAPGCAPGRLTVYSEGALKEVANL
ncbi:50S ribosomal protein L4 [uncultured archaeon]|nr:50S ribosomal protein L4 [uncultured archaeon]